MLKFLFEKNIIYLKKYIPIVQKNYNISSNLFYPFGASDLIGNVSSLNLLVFKYLDVFNRIIWDL